LQIPQIKLHQTYAQIGLRTTQPVQEIHQQPADLSIEQTPAQMEIERQPAQLEIDQEQAWQDLGFKSVSVMTSENADFAEQEVFNALAEIAEEGDRMAAIQNKTNVFADIAAEKALPGPIDFTIGVVPSYGSVKLHYTPAEVHINWQQGGAKIDSTPHQPVHNYTPGQTEVYMRQMQDLQIDFVGSNVNSKA